MKFKFSMNRALIFTVIVAIIAAAGIFYYQQTTPITSYTFYGQDITFRDDLRSSDAVPIYPDREAVLNTMWNPDIQDVTIVYVNSTDNGIVAVNSFEIAYKLRIAYLTFNWNVPVYGMEVDSFENLTGSNENLIIVLVPPSMADETSVEMHDGAVYIKGKTSQELDRATIKFLMASMNITV
ncbi:MAG: hypothetical protein HYT70_00120 [Candidatus Aenigmarchaeota archaeon]|nr:hypothetical protein [Candidatus Aenigmarchaeota archaeon]